MTWWLRQFFHRARHTRRAINAHRISVRLHHP